MGMPAPGGHSRSPTRDLALGPNLSVVTCPYWPLVGYKIDRAIYELLYLFNEDETPPTPWGYQVCGNLVSPPVVLPPGPPPTSHGTSPPPVRDGPDAPWRLLAWLGWPRVARGGFRAQNGTRKNMVLWRNGFENGDYGIPRDPNGFCGTQEAFGKASFPPNTFKQ